MMGAVLHGPLSQRPFFPPEQVQGGTVCCPLVVSAEIYRLLGDRLRRMELGRASSRRGLYAVQWDVPARKVPVG